jgi:hypothetical protein
LARHPSAVDPLKRKFEGAATDLKAAFIYPIDHRVDKRLRELVIRCRSIRLSD